LGRPRPLTAHQRDEALQRLRQGFFGYAEEYLVDVKFVRDRIGTVLFDHLVGAPKQRERES
jgi:hypothetical protein